MWSRFGARGRVWRSPGLRGGPRDQGERVQGRRVGRGHMLETLTEVVWAPETLRFSLFLSPGGGSLPGQGHLSLQPSTHPPDGPKRCVFFTIFEPGRGFSVRPETPLSLQHIRLRGYPRPTSGNQLDKPYCRGFYIEILNSDGKFETVNPKH